MEWLATSVHSYPGQQDIYDNTIPSTILPSQGPLLGDTATEERSSRSTSTMGGGGCRRREPSHIPSVLDGLKELEPTIQVVQMPLDGCMHMAGKDIKQLCSLVAFPRNEDAFIPGLRDAVEAYYEEVITLLDKTGELVLQRLNSPDPTKM
ncbi:hypothetical protein EDD16DRAFT_1527306 [Pisolithus croceorrhizus]|nr:hypothetical protein EDD16DRAFT_1527306 [Pisolithus croceorrhizus]KAI6112333.1 hypothetical protein EV401DRAFT_1890452 [Pisolithus croceorrhizus]KAI6151401.1 hypothetical protein EDD17DRAFT_1513401 [Pisolithus thermaeus]